MKFRNLALMLTLIATKGMAQLPAPDMLQTKKGPLTIQPVQHASLVLKIAGTTIYADPDGGAEKYKGLGEPDLILVTDIHGDHFNPATIDSVKTAKTVLVVPQAVADKLSAEDKAKAVIIKNGEHITQSGIPITAIPMYNPPGGPDAKHPKGRGNGYVLNIGGKNIYLSGDTEDIPEMRALKNIDLAFVCMNLPYTMDVDHAASAVLAFKPKIVYAYHYRGQNGLSDVNAFKSKVEAGDKNIEVRLRNWYATAAH